MKNLSILKKMLVLALSAAMLLAVHLDCHRLTHEHRLNLLLRHALSVVGNGDEDAVFLLAGGECDALFPRDVPQAVVDRVFDDRL